MNNFNCKWCIVIIIVTASVVSLISSSISSNKSREFYKVKSVAFKKEYDSLVNVYSIQIDSLHVVILELEDIDDSLSKAIGGRAKVDSINYDKIFNSDPDTSFLIIEQYLDSLHADPKYKGIHL